jgi:hypothetical protein
MASRLLLSALFNTWFVGILRIETISTNVFLNTVDLQHLELSDNQLESLPPQLRRLVNLQVLNINNNPMGHFQFR